MKYLVIFIIVILVFLSQVKFIADYKPAHIMKIDGRLYAIDSTGKEYCSHDPKVFMADSVDIFIRVLDIPFFDTVKIVGAR